MSRPHLLQAMYARVIVRFLSITGYSAKSDALITTNPFANVLINEMLKNLGQPLTCLRGNLLRFCHSCVFAYILYIVLQMK